MKPKVVEKKREYTDLVKDLLPPSTASSSLQKSQHKRGLGEVKNDACLGNE